MSAILRSVRAVRIFTSDLVRARHFYGDILHLRETSTGPSYVTFDIGGIVLVVEALANGHPEREMLLGRFVAVSFGCGEEIGEAYRRLLAQGVEFAEPPERQSWGGTLVHLRDPDGNVLTLVG